MSNTSAADQSRFTPEQKQAIDARGVSVALSAGAGCGKTFVLTERYLADFDPADSAALQPSELGQLVAITFTERAAREMRDRIRATCRKRLLAASDRHAEYWAELLRNLDNARISTIHSFCGSLLRSRAVEAGIDPQFDVLQQAQADTLLSEAIDDELRQRVADHDADTFELVARFDLNSLHDMLRRLVLACRGDQAAAWLAIDPAQQVAEWKKYLQDTVLPEILPRLRDSNEARQIVELLRDDPNHPKMQARREVLLEKLTGPQAPGATSNLFAELEAIRENAKVQGVTAAKAWDNAETFHAFKSVAEDLRKEIDRAKTIMAFDPRAAETAAVAGRQLLSLAAAVHGRYAERKAELNVLDFNDLLSRTQQFLTAPAHRALREQLSSQIRLLLVDEFQDTDPTQVDLVQALCGDALTAGKLFVVGDYKQSIYRFRGADPQVFRKLREQTPPAGQLSLTRNFRSQPAILDFVNTLFRHELGAGYEDLRADRPQVTEPPAIEFLWAPAERDKETRDELRRREAQWIARRVRALLDGGEPLVWDTDAATSGAPAARPAQAGDIAILFRALSDVAIYEEALRDNNIDYYLVGGHAFYAQQEIFDLLNLLRTLNSPSDQVSLAGVLRSGFFSLTDETLFWLAQHTQGLSGGLFASEHPAELTSEQQDRVRFAAETLLALRATKDQLRICELIERALALTGYDAGLLNEFLGERKLANLRKLIEQARSFDQAGFFALADFIAQLAEFVVRQPDEPLAATHSENTSVVRLMTIHQSKGLEFPIVIVPDVDRASHSRSDNVHFDARLGPLVRISDDSDRSAVLGGYDLWRFVERREELDEVHRLLYVATTRAADYLMLSGGVQLLGSTKGPWTRLLARHFDLQSGRFLGPDGSDPIPQIRVTSTEPPKSVEGSSQQRRVDWEQVLSKIAASAPVAASYAHGVDPIPPDRSARRQYSFSRLAGTLHRQIEEPDTLERTAASGIDARGLGTLVHAVLAAVDFKDSPDVGRLVRLHAERQEIADARLIAEALALVERFATSARAQALAGARESYAELEFVLAWPPDRKTASPIILGGFIDRLYQDDAGEWHLLDYKTNQVQATGVERAAADYEMQMLVYALATEQILGRAPQSLVLHFLRTGAEHAFAWDDAARARARQLVEQSLAALEAAPV